MKQVIKLNDNTVVTIENRCICIVQQLFTDKSVVVINIDDINRILSEYNTSAHQ